MRPPVLTSSSAESSSRCAGSPRTPDRTVTSSCPRSPTSNPVRATTPRPVSTATSSAPESSTPSRSPARRCATPLRSPPWFSPPRPWSSRRRKRRTRTERSARPESPLRHTSGPEPCVPGHSCIHTRHGSAEELRRWFGEERAAGCRELRRWFGESSVCDRWLWFHSELPVADRALGRSQTRYPRTAHPDASQLLASHFSCSWPRIVVSLDQTDCSNPGAQQLWRPATLRDSMTTVSQMPIARLRDVSKVFDPKGAAVTALNRVSLDIAPARLTAVMGPSGSGKSTLMHVIAGLDRPTSGRVHLGEKEITGLREDELSALRRRRIGFVFQAFNLVPTLTVRGNIRLPFELDDRRPNADERAWISTVVARLGLESRLKHRPGELSGGQQQRTAIARALATRPDILFADAPTGNLDARSGREVMAIMSEA